MISKKVRGRMTWRTVKGGKVGGRRRQPCKKAKIEACVLKKNVADRT